MLLFTDSSISFCCFFSEEIISVENIICPNENSSDKNRSNPSKPPSVGLHNEVSIVEHFLFQYQLDNIIVL